jgi:hypothetical protein
VGTAPHAVAAALVAAALLTGCGSEPSIPSQESRSIREADATPRPAPSSRDRDDFNLSTLTEGWTELAQPPEIRVGAAQVWTGAELLVWGGGLGDKGSEHPLNDGIRYLAVTDSWERIPPAPIAARSYPASAWTGTELVVWGGWHGSWTANEPRTFDDGAAYDPDTGRWRKLPPAPIDARAPLFVWTGEELIVWGTSLRTSDRPLDGAAYDPVSDTWRTIADGPIELTDATAVWTGEEMIVFGAALHGGNVPETPTAIGAAYDPSADTWRELPASEIDPNANTTNWLADRLIAWDYSEQTSAYSPETDAWMALAGPPVDACEDTPSGVSADGFIFGELCAEQIVMLRGEGRWHNVTRRDLPFMPATFAAAGGAVLVLGYEGDFFDPFGPFQLFAYRPPSSFVCGGFSERGSALAAAVAARFELLRSDRAEVLGRPEIEDLLSADGDAAYSAPENGLEGLFGGHVHIDRITSIEPAGEGSGFVVEVRMWNLNGSGKVTEQLTLRPGRNLAGDECELVVIDARLVSGSLA